MAELVDALDSGSSRGNLVEVRVFLAANPRTFFPSEKFVRPFFPTSSLKLTYKLNCLIKEAPPRF